jgi:myosin heavy subunit
MDCFGRCFRGQDENQNYGRERERENFKRGVSNENKKPENHVFYKDMSEVESAIKNSESREDRRQVYAGYFSYLNKEIPRVIGDLNKSGCLGLIGEDGFINQYEKIKKDIELALEGKDSSFHRYAKFLPTYHDKMGTLRVNIEKLSGLYKTLVNECQKREQQEDIRKLKALQDQVHNLCISANQTGTIPLWTSVIDQLKKYNEKSTVSFLRKECIRPVWELISKKIKIKKMELNKKKLKDPEIELNSLQDTKREEQEKGDQQKKLLEKQLEKQKEQLQERLPEKNNNWWEKQSEEYKEQLEKRLQEEGDQQKKRPEKLQEENNNWWEKQSEEYKEQLEKQFEKRKEQLEKQLEEYKGQLEKQLEEYKEQLEKQFEKQLEEHKVRLQGWLQSIEIKLQKERQELQRYKKNLQSLKNASVDPTVFEGFRKHLHELINSERQLIGEKTVLNEKLKGLPRRRLRQQIWQRVDKLLSRHLAPEQLQSQVLALRASVLRDFCKLEPEEKLLKAEFQGVLHERWSHHDHPEQELVNILEYFLLEGGYKTSQPMKSKESDQ